MAAWAARRVDARRRESDDAKARERLASLGFQVV
jgi:hypothetical protein